MIPPVIRFAGVTSKAGFQQEIPVVNIEKLIIGYVVGAQIDWKAFTRIVICYSDICWQIFDSLISIICSTRSDVPVLTQNSKKHFKKVVYNQFFSVYWQRDFATISPKVHSF